MSESRAALAAIRRYQRFQGLSPEITGIFYAIPGVTAPPGREYRLSKHSLLKLKLAT